MPTMAEFEMRILAPPWSKFEGVPLAHLSIDDLRDLHRQARVVSVRLVVERELRRRLRKGARRRIEGGIRHPR